MSEHETILSELHSYAGDIFKELTLPFKSSAASRSFRCSGVNSGISIVAAALTNFRLKEGEKITFELLESDSGKGYFSNREIIGVISGPVSFFAGDEMMRFSLDSWRKCYLKLKISDNADLSSAVITAYLLRKG